MNCLTALLVVALLPDAGLCNNFPKALLVVELVDRDVVEVAAAWEVGAVDEHGDVGED